MSTFITFTLREFMYGGHLQAIGAAAIVYIAAILLGHAPLIGMLLAVYLVFQAIYYFDRYRDMQRDGETNPERTHHLRTYYHLMPVVVLIFLGVAAGILILFGTTLALLFALVITLFGGLYPLFFKGLTTYIPLFKNVYVALVFGLLIWFPFLYHGTPVVINELTGALFVFVFLESVITQMILDMKDQKSDVRRGLLTLPVLVGKKQSFYVITALSILTAAVAVLYALGAQAGVSLIPLALVTLLFNFLVLILIAQGFRMSFVVAAGKYWLWPLALIFV